jgi:UDP-3-O-[3-hydroxymyristoyl] N-acetylglucosamine deacetylase
VRTDVQDRDNRVPVTAESVCQTQLGTVINNGDDVRVSTIEHLMAALAALSIDNCVVELDGPEVPIMDGSSEPFVQILDRAGRRKQEAVRQYIEILAPITVEEGDKRASLLPSDRFEVAFEIAFGSKAIGRQAVDLTSTKNHSARSSPTAAPSASFATSRPCAPSVWPVAVRWTTPWSSMAIAC